MTRPIDAESRPITSPDSPRSKRRSCSLPGHSSTRSPAVNKVERPGESPEVATARHLVDQCDYFLAALNAHCQVIAPHLPDRHPDKFKYDDDIPF
ncbi:MAG: hypothetical protein E6J90_36030 [Deltaproteobacteria bacterium]|nr:MAG: hypothetical protein E6J90_36030 [Deltaproteobacteria bacterium]TMQ17635.1 MAG: hypothetical protein E6J91_09670 [Deltaproteobacteria bacterium]